jgi:hypothetical protein
MSNKDTPILYGLLFVDRDSSDHVNLKKARIDPLEVYIRCAALCAASIAFHGLEFHLVSNQARYVRKRLEMLELRGVSVIEHRFSLKVPSRIPFYSAHFKLELLEAFGQGLFGEHVGLIDIDSVMCSPLSVPPVGPRTLIAYDITDQIVPDYGAERVRSDLERIAAAPVSSLRWFGGEFLLGHAESFQLLHRQVASFWPRYIDLMTTLHHVGDETLLSAALAVTSEIAVIDAGDCGLVARWWTARTRSRQRPFIQVRKRSLLHLPSDKPFLASWAGRVFDPQTFVAAYERNASAKLRFRRIYNLARRVILQDRKFVGQLR